VPSGPRITPTRALSAHASGVCLSVDDRRVMLSR
jgi:hypothetical protein